MHIIYIYIYIYIHTHIYVLYAYARLTFVISVFTCLLLLALIVQTAFCRVSGRFLRGGQVASSSSRRFFGRASEIPQCPCPRIHQTLGAKLQGLPSGNVLGPVSSVLQGLGPFFTGWPHTLKLIIT